MTKTLVTGGAGFIEAHVAGLYLFYPFKL